MDDHGEPMMVAEVNGRTAPGAWSVTALVPTYNRRERVLRALDSIVSQEPAVDEVIVVDDGSTDGSAEAIGARFGKRVRVVCQANGGVSAARYRGIREARGEWIAFLDSDDTWTPGRMGRLLDAGRKAPAAVGWIFGDVEEDLGEGKTRSVFETHGLKVEQTPTVFSDPWTVQFPYQFPMLQASLVRRSALVELGCYREGLRSNDDLLVGYQMATRCAFAAIPDVTTRMGRTSDLAASSVEVNGRLSPEYFRSRMMAFALATRHDPSRPWWREQYEGSVRGLAVLESRRGRRVVDLALKQFEFGASARSVAFLGLALLGRPGVRLWEAMRDRRSA